MENMKSTLTFSFSQIKDVSVLSDMTSMQNGSPVGRAIVGGILAGGIGAIIGVGSGLSDSEACKSLKVRVTLFNDHLLMNLLLLSLLKHLVRFTEISVQTVANCAVRYLRPIILVILIFQIPSKKAILI